MLDRDTTGAGKSLIDAHSNLPFLQQSQQNTYRGSYGTSSPMLYTTTANSYRHHGYGNSFDENYESKKIVVDVRFSSYLKTKLN